VDDFWEIVELETGELALQRSDADETLITVKLSPTLIEQFPDQYVEVAKVMLSAGMQMVSDLSEQAVIKRNVEFEDQNVH
jgi:hypothetical protein